MFLQLQLQHGGRIGHPDTSGLTAVAPSPVPLPDTIFTPSGHQAAVTPREMTLDEIHTTVADFAAAARNAIDAGFEGGRGAWRQRLPHPPVPDARH
jgi:N-ethylmaleimide reductase